MIDPRVLRHRLLAGVALFAFAPVAAEAGTIGFGTLFATTSIYAGNAGTVMVGQALPNSTGVAAIANGTYPTVFNNDTVDGNFGIAAPIQLTSFLSVSFDGLGVLVGPPTGFVDVTGKTGIVTSFSSKSELALNASTDGKALTFMGYRAAVNALDISNANTAGHVDPTNTDTAASTPRSVVEVDLGGTATATDTESYSGNNGRAAVLVRGTGGNPDSYVMVGNAGNGSGTEPVSIVQSTGVQTIAPHATNPLATTVGVQQGTPGSKNGFEYGFSVASLGDAADKSGKDDNFRGLTVFDGNVYVSKGSGGNGVDTVYQVSSPGGAIAAGAAQTTISILPGFPTALASGTPTFFFPFGIWFANATTLYVGDEGTQSLAPDANAGLQKWIYDGSQWNLAYVISKGLDLGQPGSVANYPSNVEPATTGLRNITGFVQGNTVSVFAATATFSGLGDPGADPNSVVEVVDQLDATTPPVGASFRTIAPAIPGLVYRGLAFVPCTTLAACTTNSRVVAR